MKKLSGEDKAGLYITVIVHLTVIIILLLSQISSALKGGDSFLLDFSKDDTVQEQKPSEQQDEPEDFGEDISKKVEDLLNGTSGIDFKNVAVNRSSALKDDRGTDADQLYKDAEKLAKDLKSGFKVENDDDYAAVEQKTDKSDQKQAKEYSGPSVVSYELGNRKASRLPIPAYRCYGGGMVTVIITVDNAGNVVNAKIQEEVSTDDRCLREFAIRAARMSKFSSDPKAPARQGGNIVYQFLAQR